MPTINEQILESFVSHSVWLERYKTGTVNKIIKLLNKADEDLAAQLEKRLRDIAERGFDIGPDTTKRLNEILSGVREQRTGLYKLLYEETRGELNKFATYEASFVSDVIEASIGSAEKVTMAKPSLSKLKAAVEARPFQGRILKEWFSGLADGDTRRVSDAVRVGMVQGQTLDQIVRRIRGTRAAGFKDGILEVSRREASAVVRTSIGHVANYASEELYAANADIVKGVQWISTLDGRTSAVCRARDGQVYAIGKGPRPPAHWNCRSRTVPYLGETSIKGVRASATGPVPSDMTYNDWLKAQSTAVQDDILGKAKGRLFREGGVTLDRFVDQSGKELSLQQMAKADNAAFEKVFGGQAGLTRAERLRNEGMFREWIGERKFNNYFEEANDVLAITGGSRGRLSDAELVSLYAYTGPHYRELNAALRSGNAARIADVAPFRSVLSAGLNKLPVYNGYVSRVVSFDDDMVAAIEVGKTYKDPAFMSTSRKKSNFSGNVEFVIYSRSGRKVEHLSAHRHEAEVLFAHDAEFRIEAVKREGGKTIVYMKEI